MEEEMDVSQYLEIFLDETNEHLQNLNTQILELESDPENMDNINEIFRAAHSLKGMAGTMGYKRMQNLTHDMENVFSEVRNGMYCSSVWMLWKSTRTIFRRPLMREPTTMRI
mgnify:CR=1 FL=1